MLAGQTLSVTFTLHNAGPLAVEDILLTSSDMESIACYSATGWFSRFFSWPSGLPFVWYILMYVVELALVFFSVRVLSNHEHDLNGQGVLFLPSTVSSSHQIKTHVDFRFLFFIFPLAAVHAYIFCALCQFFLLQDRIACLSSLRPSAWGVGKRWRTSQSCCTEYWTTLPTPNVQLVRMSTFKSCFVLRIHPVIPSRDYSCGTKLETSELAPEFFVRCWWHWIRVSSFIILQISELCHFCREHSETSEETSELAAPEFSVWCWWHWTHVCSFKILESSELCHFCREHSD